MGIGEEDRQLEAVLKVEKNDCHREKKKRKGEEKDPSPSRVPPGRRVKKLSSSPMIHLEKRWPLAFLVKKSGGISGTRRGGEERRPETSIAGVSLDCRVTPQGRNSSRVLRRNKKEVVGKGGGGLGAQEVGTVVL